jgi:hypothetical protein
MANGSIRLSARKLGMRLIFRITGTLLLAAALILLILDGTRSLGANRIVVTPLSDSWMLIHPDSLAQLQAFLASRFFGDLLETVVGAILAFPGWAVLGVPGAILAWLGRSRRIHMFVRQDQF